MNVSLPFFIATTPYGANASFTSSIVSVPSTCTVTKFLFKVLYNKILVPQCALVKSLIFVVPVIDTVPAITSQVEDEVFGSLTV